MLRFLSRPQLRRLPLLPFARASFMLLAAALDCSVSDDHTVVVYASVVANSTLNANFVWQTDYRPAPVLSVAVSNFGSNT